MEDTTISIIAIFIAAIVMFIVPLIFISDRSDDIAQLTAQTATANFVDDVIKSGKITMDDYNDFKNLLVTTGNAYEIDMELQVLDHNTAKVQEIGKNTYYSVFTNQIEEKLIDSDKSDDGVLNDTGLLLLKEGDGISVTVRNRSLTLSQALKNVYYKIIGEDLHIIVATSSGIIAINGAT